MSQDSGFPFTRRSDIQWNFRNNFRFRSSSPSRNYQQRGQSFVRNTAQRSVAPRVGFQTRSSRQGQFNQGPICWNCKEHGHYRRSCRRKIYKNFSQKETGRKSTQHAYTNWYVFQGKENADEHRHRRNRNNNSSYVTQGHEQQTTITGQRRRPGLQLQAFFNESTTEEQILKAQLSDRVLKLEHNKLKKGKSSSFILNKEGLLSNVYKNRTRVIIPDNMADEVIRQIHSRSHIGFYKIKNELNNKKLFIRKLRTKVQHLLTECGECNTIKSQPVSYANMLLEINMFLEKLKGLEYQRWDRHMKKFREYEHWPQMPLSVKKLVAHMREGKNTYDQKLLSLKKSKFNPNTCEEQDTETNESVKEEIIQEIQTVNKIDLVKKLEEIKEKEDIIEKKEEIEKKEDEDGKKNPGKAEGKSILDWFDNFRETRNKKKNGILKLKEEEQTAVGYVSDEDDSELIPKSLDAASRPITRSNLYLVEDTTTDPSTCFNKNVPSDCLSDNVKKDDDFFGIVSRNKWFESQLNCLKERDDSLRVDKSSIEKYDERMRNLYRNTSYKYGHSLIKI